MRTEIVFIRGPIAIRPHDLPSREVGACVEFQGIVRELENGQLLEGLHYESYESMASRQLERIFEKLGREHCCLEVMFVHRLGWVPVGEASLFLRVVAKHRGEALAFCSAAIDWMKRDVPIWKRA